MLVDKLLIEILDANCLSAQLRAKAIEYLETYSDYDPAHLDDFREHVDNSPLSMDEIGQFNEIIRQANNGAAFSEIRDTVNMAGYIHEMFPINNLYIDNRVRQAGYGHPYIARMVIRIIGDSPINRVIVPGRMSVNNWRSLILDNTELCEIVDSLNVG